MSFHNVADATGVRVMADKCATCIFRPGNLMELRRGRVRDMVEEATGNEGVIVCHDTLNDDKAAVCKGYAERHAPPLLQIAERLDHVVPWTREKEAL
jgi:hypothetical protein